MLDNFDEACEKIGLRLNLTKTVFMKNGLVSFAPFTLNGTNISGYVYLGREVNVMNDLARKMSRRKRSAWGVFKNIEGNFDEHRRSSRTENTQIYANIFDFAILDALTYASETWSLREQDERLIIFIERSVQRKMLGVFRVLQIREVFQAPTSDHDQKSKMPFYTPFTMRCTARVMCVNCSRWTGAASN
uniref:Reverse transcriptase domain-containing protein n=1 Tax=Angiostrongylus cantonensis TaxID=6313 RepID=A0A0K0D6I3_ANGCA